MRTHTDTHEGTLNSDPFSNKALTLRHDERPYTPKVVRTKSRTRGLSGSHTCGHNEPTVPHHFPHTHTHTTRETVKLTEVVCADQTLRTRVSKNKTKHKRQICRATAELFTHGKKQFPASFNTPQFRCSSSSAFRSKVVVPQQAGHGYYATGV